MALTKESQLERLLKRIRILQKDGFFGQVELEIHGGDIVLVRLKQSIKLETEHA